MEEDKFRIIAENISKKFKRDFKKRDGILGKLLGFLDKGPYACFYALNDVSFNGKAGEVIGIIGRNASGKSTLLRILAGIYKPNNGNVKINGRTVYLGSFNPGLKTKLTMRENIYLTGSIMGLSQSDIKRKFDEIVDFSGLKDYVDARLYQFSTGMITRLNFSIMLFCVKHQNPDILLLDEIFSAGGDAEFREKAIKKMEELIKGGATVVLVSHDLAILEKYCDRLILLDNGKVIREGKPREVIEEYMDSIK
ncbi:ABC transporter ATP-binding protein [Candidatus Pacearchaeota archaeon]|nr:ABC transporter ATP-binding protein [Candidatus Pacearchaeota archaeon]